MGKRILTIFLVIITILTAVPFGVGASGVATVDVPVEVNFTGATGVDINIRVNSELVEEATLVNPSAVLSDAFYVCNQDGDKVKVAIASVSSVNCSGALFSLRLTLKKAVGADDELFKIVQVKINEKITYQAENNILLSGVKDGGIYYEPVEVYFNEGTATLNGSVFTGGVISEAGSHTLKVTDLKGNVRVVSFEIKSADEICSDVYRIEDKLVKNVREKTTVSDLLSKMKPGGSLKVYKGTSLVGDSSFVGTGMTVKLEQNSEIRDEVTVVVPGDVTGDGKVMSIDYMKIKRAVQSSGTLTDVQFIAGDLNGNGVLQSNDYLKIKRHFKGTYNIYDYI